MSDERSESVAEPKVTECWAWQENEEGRPHIEATRLPTHGSDPAILMWKEDYDAMRKELEELREWRKAVKGGYRGV
jgi:hypothetical protein